jgi:hypothetical protein
MYENRNYIQTIVVENGRYLSKLASSLSES